MTRAAVFAGGGLTGIAWMVGLLSGLRDRGVEVGAADTLIGTSAGSTVATVLATDRLAESAARQRSVQSPEIAANFDLATFNNLAAQAAGEGTSRQDAVRRLANLPQQDLSVDPDRRRAAVAARLPDPNWPAADLRITAVEQETGRRVVFTRADGVDLIDAVAASSAVPGVWPPVLIDGRFYVDGGAHSMTNADLATGAERVLVFIPLAPTGPQQDTLEWELDRIGRDRALVVSVDEASTAAMGPNALDPARRPAALDAGERQARSDAELIGDFWAG